MMYYYVSYSERMHLTNKTNKTNKKYMNKFLTVCNIYINIEEIIKYLNKTNSAI